MQLKQKISRIFVISNYKCTSFAIQQRLKSNKPQNVFFNSGPIIFGVVT